MKKNPILENMKSKARNLESAMHTLLKLMNGGSINLGGIYPVDITAPQTPEAHDNNLRVLSEIQKEYESLITRIRRLDPYFE